MILVTHSYFLNRDAKQLVRMTPYSPLSTLIAAAVLRDRGHGCALFDSTFKSGIADFELALACHRPRLVAIMEDNFNFLTKMCTTNRRADAFAMIAMAKSRGCRVVVNGPDSTERPDSYLAAGADAVLMGEGETALAEIAEPSRFDDGDALREIAGLCIRGIDGEVLRTRPRRAEKNIDRFPLPDWSLLDVDDYRRAWHGKHGYLSWNIASSRGCPYPCNWCAKPTFGRGYEQRSPGSVVRELLGLKEDIAPDHIWFADDIFGLTAEWLGEFAYEAERTEANIPFTIQSRVNLMKPEAVGYLAKAGGREVWLGVESGSQKILNAMDKASRVDDARAATRTLKARNIRACWFIQLGYPGESWEDISLTRDLIRDERPDDIGVSVAYPLPGTRFYELVKTEMRERYSWTDSDDLAMLFEGTYDTHFYRLVRDVLHEEVRTGLFDDHRWQRLGFEGIKYRSTAPITLATGS